jgi:hypothetical protein
MQKDIAEREAAAEAKRISIIAQKKEKQDEKKKSTRPSVIT